MWIYRQRTGELFRGNDCSQKAYLLKGYSGLGPDKNLPDSERKVGMGPIPCGAYNIGAESESDAHGPVALHLLPCVGTKTYGRSGFMVHGDNATKTASHGCIIMPRNVREQMRDGDDKLLIVLSGSLI